MSLAALRGLPPDSWVTPALEGAGVAMPPLAWVRGVPFAG